MHFGKCYNNLPFRLSKATSTKATPTNVNNNKIFPNVTQNSVIGITKRVIKLRSRRFQGRRFLPQIFQNRPPLFSYSVEENIISVSRTKGISFGPKAIQFGGRAYEIHFFPSLRAKTELWEGGSGGVSGTILDAAPLFLERESVCANICRPFTSNKKCPQKSNSLGCFLYVNGSRCLVKGRALKGTYFLLM
ncbi:hypothetical protein CEXT_167421 [Caerostris extrusa]|uniref:Ribosomal protein L5 n=1 Tax=Caerostris extrusa TaxID=172846 RepID=A0AAV4W5R8_CAEEX|nr:hypothetical protein CEXT_167421 [Caerostris extrusa]